MGSVAITCCQVTSRCTPQDRGGVYGDLKMLALGLRLVAVMKQDLTLNWMIQGKMHSSRTSMLETKVGLLRKM